MNITPRLQRAIEIAIWAHRHQKRKGTTLPYITHPFGVMCLVASVTDDEEVLIASIFHDTLEDVAEEYPREQMLEDFGDRVVSIVDGVTKDSRITDWQASSEDYLVRLRQAPIESVTVATADKIHNLEATLSDRIVVEDQLWTRFHTGKERQEWLYGQVILLVEERLPESPLTARLRTLIDKGLLADG